MTWLSVVWHFGLTFPMEGNEEFELKELSKMPRRSIWPDHIYMLCRVSRIEEKCIHKPLGIHCQWLDDSMTRRFVKKHSRSIHLDWATRVAIISLKLGPRLCVVWMNEWFFCAGLRFFFVSFDYYCAFCMNKRTIPRYIMGLEIEALQTLCWCCDEMPFKISKRLKIETIIVVAQAS